MSLDEYLDRAKRLLIPKGDVTERAVKSGIWVTLINVFDRILQLAKLVVLARLLAPSDFGLMGIALLTLAGLQQFSKLGIDTALIQQEEDDVDEYLNTAWSMKAVRGVIITGVAFVLAPYAAQFFSEPRATDIIRVIALSPLITGLQNPGVMYLRKNLEFHKQFVYKLSSTLINVSVAIGAAFILQSVWALVYGYLAGSIITLFSSYILYDYRPKIEFHREIFDELLNYGKWITGSGILVFLIGQGDDVFVGWFFTAGVLGIYQVSYRLSNAPATEITQVVSRIALPTYSKIQSSTSDLSKAFFKSLKITVMISFPMAVGIIIVAPVFVKSILGSEWMAAVPLIQILAVYGLLRSAGSNIGPFFEAIDRPDINTKFQFIKTLLLFISIYPLSYQFGIEGVAATITVISMFTAILYYYLILNELDESYMRLFKVLSIPLSASIIMGLALLGIKDTIVFQPLLSFFILVTSGMAIYFMTMYVLDSIFDYGVADIFKMILDNL